MTSVGDMPASELTKREYLIAEIAGGIDLGVVSRDSVSSDVLQKGVMEYLPEVVILFADAIIERLDKEEK